MIINLSNGGKIDAERELTAEERHIVQKLYAWASVVDSISAFREKKEQAVNVGWNNSGPVIERRILKRIVSDIEKSIRSRLNHPAR